MGLPRVAARAVEVGATALQIFSDNPTSWRRRPEPPPEAAAFKARLAELDIGPLAIHASYLVNLAGSDEALVEKSVEVLRHELELAPAFGAAFVNVHAGSHRGAGVDAGVTRLVEGLSRALSEAPDGPGAAVVAVENSSGGGDAIGVTLEQLARVLDGAGQRGLDGRVRFCLDTAHLWGAGYDIADPAEVERIVAEWDRLIGLDRLAMIHFNDTHSGLGSRHDRHAHLGEGRIGAAGMGHLLRHPALDHVAFYLETPDMEKGFDAINMARIGDLAWGRPLTRGPEPAPEEESAG
jgi:deoxyribonuclease-4